jgi:hypothetical protein
VATAHHPSDFRTPAFHRAYLVVCVALFAYAVVAWRGLMGVERPWEPTRFMALTTGMLLQAIAAFAQQRSFRLFYSLLLASFVAIGLGFVLRT